MRRVLCLAMVIAIFTACSDQKSVDMIVTNAQIYTVNQNFDTVQAMVIDDENIIDLGSTEEMLKKYGSKAIVDAGGKFIYPGLIDAHCHFTGYATDRWKCDVVGTESWQEIVDSIKSYSMNAPMQWIYGRGWDQNDWLVKQYPNKSKLDSLFPDRPVYLKRVDGHAAIANQAALNIAGITATTKIIGGEIDLKNGQPSGLLIDNAMDLVEAFIPAISDSLATAYFSELQDECFAVGLTGVHDCGISEHTVDLVDAAQKEGNLKMKIYALLTDSAHYYKKWVNDGPYKTDRLHVGGFKVYADGALGSRGACMLDHYSDKPDWYGFLLSDRMHFDSVAHMLEASKLQMCTHAIGDSANREMLKIYASVLGGKNDRRWRIEHAQIVNESDFHYFEDYNIIPSIQPTHATSDMYWAEQRIGKTRLAGAYAYNRLCNTNGWLPSGTDFPVEAISPFNTMYAAVARKDAKGFPEAGFLINEALTREQALRSMTIWAAKAAFEEKEKGSLEKYKIADFIILDRDIMSCPIKDVLKTKVLATYINGEKVFGQP